MSRLLSSDHVLVNCTEVIVSMVCLFSAVKAMETGSSFPALSSASGVTEMVSDPLIFTYFPSPSGYSISSTV